MKKATLITSLMGLSLLGMAQTTPRTQTMPKMPDNFLIALTKHQILKIDSAINAGANWTDSKTNTKWFLQAFDPFYTQIQKQMVADTVQKKSSK